MNKDELIKQAKELISKGNIEKAKSFLEEHKDEIGEQYDKLKKSLPDFKMDDIADQVKGFFKK
ncbi:hypothetical protein [Enterococcus sp. BWR-S5]|uniref:hypothetical protein n=1 Tax=Enterococcus sp. BWR-S5 TaxID=2787714 RepID=UPI0019245145|nr:hypothetical protein [Enterococcus sp. BWR-S5]MBL1226976.1 hypothetical protein [Enterococcus sp. BWR-S5]